jgi:hypothetical protein
MLFEHDGCEQGSFEAVSRSLFDDAAKAAQRLANRFDFPVVGKLIQPGLNSIRGVQLANKPRLGREKVCGVRASLSAHAGWIGGNDGITSGSGGSWWAHPPMKVFPCLAVSNTSSSSAPQSGSRVGCDPAVVPALSQ